MKKGKLKKILATGAMGIMALAMPFTLTGCTNKSNLSIEQDKLDNLLSAVQNYCADQNISMPNYIDNVLAWNIFTEAKYKLNTSYNNCINNLQIDIVNYWQSKTHSSTIQLQYYRGISNSGIQSYTIRYKGTYDGTSSYDDIYFNDNSKFNVATNTITTANYDHLRYNKQMKCLTNVDICFENLLYCEMNAEGEYIFKFTKTYDVESDYDDYEAFYEVKLTKDKMFAEYKNYVKTNTSSGYIDYTETYSYNVVNGEELLNLIENNQ